MLNFFKVKKLWKQKTYTNPFPCFPTASSCFRCSLKSSCSAGLDIKCETVFAYENERSHSLTKAYNMIKQLLLVFQLFKLFN